jgi:hypothetical protein
MQEKRKPGRPRIAPELRLSVTVQILVTPDEADALYSNSRKRRRPMSELVRDACRRAGLLTPNPEFQRDRIRIENTE